MTGSTAQSLPVSRGTFPNTGPSDRLGSERLCAQRVRRRCAVAKPGNVFGDLLLGVFSQVPGGVVDLDHAAGHLGTEPGAVGCRNEYVRSAVADKYRHGDLPELEAPWRDVGEVVVDPARDAAQRLLPERLANQLHYLGPSELGAVGLTQLKAVENRSRIVFHLGC